MTATQMKLCSTCGTPTSMLTMDLCKRCLWVEHRLQDYLRSPTARAIVERMLHSARYIGGGKLDEPCGNGHIGFRRRRWQYDSRRLKDHLVLVCDECIRINGKRRDDKRRGKTH